ncbi:hypothetical protein MKOR_18660 [Mycolicibacillus koreensis]|uniref:Uncharacterized protein n=2 Tax=Mycolicibacillus koreensis TaxID=1069220 RepID=A0A7I7SF53_9MYCO|nr:hypothetical protein B8W67_10320 [Mycolicibacillus koreensis]BBY54615.1 hypothetical protein MKOR_18660 [Mycolicibacillus koreensis]
MRPALRPYAAAGAALVGASLIAAAPVVTPLPEVHVPDIQLTAGIVDGLDVTPWVDLFEGAFDNVSKIGAAMLADPLPALSALGSNWLGYGTEFGTTLGIAGEGLANLVTALPETLQTSFGELASGNIAQAMAVLTQQGFLSLAPLVAPVLGIANPLMGITENLATVTETALVGGAGVALSTIPALLAPAQALGDSTQIFADALTGGNPLEALSALINMPAMVLGGLLNGFQSSLATPPVPFPGLLTFDPEGYFGTGLLGGLLVAMPQAIGNALGGGSIADSFDGLLQQAMELPEQLINTLTGTLGNIFDVGSLTDIFDAGSITDGLTGLLDAGDLAGLTDLFTTLDPMMFIGPLLAMFGM